MAGHHWRQTPKTSLTDGMSTEQPAKDPHEMLDNSEPDAISPTATSLTSFCQQQAWG